MDSEGERNGSSTKRANHGDTSNPIRESDDVSNIESSIRFLISNASAGSVIGKGGATITEFQAQSGAKISLSRATEFFPGTTDRILLLSGTVSAILTALHLILSKMSEEASSRPTPSSSSRPSSSATAAAPSSPSSSLPPTLPLSPDLQLIVPSKVCGSIIGKGGSTIRSFMDDSGAHIKLSPQASPSSASILSERLATVTGSIEQQLRAVALLLTRMSEDPLYAQYTNVPLSYSASAQGPPSLIPPQSSGYSPSRLPLPPPPPHSPPIHQHHHQLHNPPHSMPGMPPLRAHSPGLIQPAIVTTTIIVAVPDEHVGSVVGKRGQSLHSIQQSSGVRISVSDRGDFVQGTTNRKLTIVGPAEGVVLAQQLIAQRVQQSASHGDERGERPYDRSGDRGDRGYESRTRGEDRPRDRDRERERGERSGDRARDRERDWERHR